MAAAMRSFVLIWMLGAGCRLFYGALASFRSPRPWVEHTALGAFMAAFWVIAATEIPPYVLQPVRVILLTALVAQMYYRLSIRKNLFLSVVFCGIYWLVSMLVVSVCYAFPANTLKGLGEDIELIVGCVHLFLMLVFYRRFRNRGLSLSQRKWSVFGLLSLCSLVVLVAFGMMSWEDRSGDHGVRLAALSGFALIQVGILYFMERLLEAEDKLQRLGLSQERTRSQMELYHNIQTAYEQQRRYLHDYKNQLQCIQGMVDKGDKEEALAYISRLTGEIRRSGDFVNANHGVVNVVLNQKYQEAREKGIVLTMGINDLSKLTLPEEDLVVLLVNLLDNAIEACELLEDQKVIKLKLMLEEAHLILSVCNPVREPVRIQGKTIATSKQDAGRHGIGLLNVDAVIRKNGGTSVIRCEEGWFSFSAMVPVGE